MRAEPGECLIERVADRWQVAGAERGIIVGVHAAAGKRGEDRMLQGCSYGLGVDAGYGPRSAPGGRGAGERFNPGGRTVPDGLG